MDARDCLRQLTALGATLCISPGLVAAPAFRVQQPGVFMIVAKSAEIPGASRLDKVRHMEALLADEIKQRGVCKEGYYLISVGDFPEEVVLRARCLDEHYAKEDAFRKSLEAPPDKITPGEPFAPMHRAAAGSFWRAIRLLAAQDPASVNARGPKGVTPLMIAIDASAPWGLRKPTVETLLELGADPNLAATNGVGPLHRLTSELVNIEPPEVVAIPGGTATLIPDAEKPDPLAVLDLLLRHGADPNARAPGWTPLHTAAARGWPSATMKLLEKGADVNAPDRNERTPLWGARHPVFELLLQKKADVNRRDRKGETVLFELLRDVKPDALERTRLAIQYGVDVNRADSRGVTPLAMLDDDPMLMVFSPQHKEQAAAKRALLLKAGAHR